MSEQETKKRSIYRKNREKLIFIQVVIAIVVAVAILISSIVAYNLNKTYYIGYREGGSVNYNVFLKDNEFYDTDYLGPNQSYVASLIDKIIADFSYEIEMDTDDVNYRYSYSVTSRLEIIDNTSKAAIYNPEYELVNKQNQSQSSENRLRINEIVVINYDEYNDLANKFLDTYSLTATTSNIVLTLDVDVLSDCNAFSGSSVDNYKSELRIPLTTKTINIKMTSAVPDQEAKMIACARGAGFEVFKTTAIVLGVIEGFLILILIAFIYLTRTEDITYITRVKKIRSQYKSYIQKINNLFDQSGYQRILVDTFDEMLEIRDTIQAPILMYENEEKTCTKFLIPTDSKLLYIYEIKIEGFSEPEVPPTPTNPQNIVSPNITNVVRPVVKVVLSTPPVPEKESAPVIETVFEEPKIEADDAVEVMATVEAIDEECAFGEEENDVENPEEAESIEDAEAFEEVIIPEEESIIPEEFNAVEQDTVYELEDVAEFEGESTEEEDLITLIDGKPVQFRYRRSFQSKLIQADEKIKSYYVAVRNKLLSYKGVKARTSWRFESCNKGRIQCAKLNIKGKALLVYLNLNTENYNENKYHFRNVGDKAKFKEVPMLLKIRSSRGLKYTLELIEEMMNVLEIPLGKVQNVEYDIPYKTTDELIKEGLIKIIFPGDEESVEDLEPVESVEEQAPVEIDPEIESILDSIPSVEDNGEDKTDMYVEAIDVFWKERPGKTYKYDPDGNAVDDGDTVLVPTRDALSDKEIVREAEVSKGNYKIEAQTLVHPLKKIIGVVRRRAEKVFMAMITPDEDDIGDK